MKQETAEVLNLDVQKLTEMLNQALAEEWLAYYQYWVGARVMEGPMRSEIESELLEHADEELEHAEKLITRIIQLGGTPVLSPDEWTRMARCRYEVPNDPYIETILEQNLRSERCAIKRYQDIADFTSGIDYTTAKMAVEILEDELDHEEDILSYQHDIAALKRTIDKMIRSSRTRPTPVGALSVRIGERSDRRFFGKRRNLRAKARFSVRGKTYLCIVQNRMP